MGSLHAGSTPSKLSQHGIRSVVDASQSSHFLPPELHRIRIGVPDNPHADLKAHFQEANAFIARSLKAGAKTADCNSAYQAIFDHV